MSNSFLKTIFPCVGGQQGEPGAEAHSRTGDMGGRKCALETDKAAGVAALVVGIGMVIMSTVLASGVFGGGNMYFIAGGLAAGSIIPFVLAAYLLHCKSADVRESGDQGLLVGAQRVDASGKSLEDFS